MDESSQTPIRDAIIHIEGIDHNVTSYEHGDYWRILSPGNYTLVVSHSKYTISYI
jgi:hypothetical protein